MIKIINARTNNLKNISLEIPKNCINVITGERVSLENKVKYSSVIDGEADADTLNLVDSTDGEAFFLHDSYSGLHQSLSPTNDSTDRKTLARLINLILHIIQSLKVLTLEQTAH